MQTTYFLYDGSDPMVEEDANGNVTAYNGYGADGLRLRYLPATQETHYFTYDPQGSLVQRVSQTPRQYGSDVEVLDTAAFDAFGALLSDYDATTDDNTGSGAGTEKTHFDSTFDPVGFGGQFGYYTDVETGLALLTNRYYDAGVGRFLNRDPISYNGGVNLYGFVGNNPVNESIMDPRI